MKICVKCKEEKPYPDFSYQPGFDKNGKYSRKARYCSWCKRCSSEMASAAGKRKRLENPELQRKIDNERYHKNKARRAPILREKVKKYKNKCVDYLGGMCKICGYNKCIAVLDFHHRDQKTKDFEVSRAGHNFNDRVKKELDKCDLLCSNCHKELHYNQENKLSDAV